VSVGHGGPERGGCLGLARGWIAPEDGDELISDTDLIILGITLTAA